MLTTICSVDGCEKVVNTLKSGLCVKHLRRWQAHGDTSVVLPNRGPPSLGFDHKPATCGRTTIHKWIRKHYPLTGRCERCGRTDRRTEYASVGHRYTRNRADWFEFCRPCHKAFDGTYVHTPEIRAKMSAAAKMRSAETLARMSAAQRGKKASPEARAKMSAAHKGKSRKRNAAGQFLPVEGRMQ